MDDLTEEESLFIRGIQEMASAVDETLTDPDDDWLATAYGMFYPNGEDEEPEFMICALDPDFLQSEKGKDALAEQVLPKVLQVRDCVAAAWLSSTWSVQPPTQAEIDDGAKAWPREMVELSQQVMPSEHPWRTEALMLMFVPRRGPVRLWMAEITRDDRKVPYLGEWEEVKNSDGEPGRMEGRFLSGLSKGVRRVETSS